jgi:hypothetical protein
MKGARSIFELPGNMFKGTTTQPVAGKFADPCAFLYYDLVATTTLHLDSLAVDTLRAGIENVTRPDSCNAAGDVARFAATTYHYFGGSDFLAVTQHALEGSQTVVTSQLNSAVAAFATPLRQYAGQYATQQSWVRHGDIYFAFAPAYVPQPRSASMSGAIRMPKGTWQSSAPDCSAFSLVGNVQTGPAPISDPERVTVGTPPGLDVGAPALAGTATDAGDHYVCTYVEALLPAGVPIVFRARGKAGSQSGHVVDKVGVTPDGWSGTSAVNGNMPDKNFIATLAPELAGFSEKARVGARLDPSDPARNYLGRTDPLVLQSTNLNVAASAAANPAQRASLNPQPLPPKAADAFTQSGNTLFARGDYAGAAVAFTQAVSLNANNAVALHNLALAHARLGQAERAKGELQRASGLAKSQGDFVTSRAAERAIIIVSGSHERR